MSTDFSSSSITPMLSPDLLSGGVSAAGMKGATQEAKIIAAVPAEADGNWHHLAATLSSKVLHFYFDGKPTGSCTAASLPIDAQFFLGSSGKTHFTAGTLDEARIYARVLDGKEIEAIYESERPKTPEPAAKTTAKSKPAK